MIKTWYVIVAIMFLFVAIAFVETLTTSAECSQKGGYLDVIGQDIFCFEKSGKIISQRVDISFFWYQIVSIN